MTLKIVTPEKVIYDGEIDELIIPTVTGEIAVLPHHIDLLTEVAAGEMTIKHKGKEQHVAVTGGFLQIENNTLTLLSNYAIKSEEIDAKKAAEAQKRAEEKLKKKVDLSERDFAIAEADMRRAILELKISSKRRGNRQQMPS
jgi:F-type H+-transporting ATPase subunit epsilon